MTDLEKIEAMFQVGSQLVREIDPLQGKPKHSSVRKLRRMLRNSASLFEGLRKQAMAREDELMHLKNGWAGEEKAYREKITELEMAVAGKQQQDLNVRWLIDQFDRVHLALCRGQNGIWQQRVEQAVVAAGEVGKRNAPEAKIVVD